MALGKGPRENINVTTVITDTTLLNVVDSSY